VRHRLCQGLNTAQLDFEDFGLKEEEQPNREAPFLSSDVNASGWDYYFMGLSSYMRCDRLMFSLSHRGEVNPYKDITTGFHITFFEILPSYESKHPKFEERGRWNHGPLYDDTDDRLCESACTVCSAPKRLQRENLNRQ
jgi:hypothetical protein